MSLHIYKLDPYYITAHLLDHYDVTAHILDLNNTIFMFISLVC